MKKIFALLLGLMMMVSSALAEESPIPTGPVDGGWTASADPTITEELNALFQAGTEALTGISYEPVAYLGSQVVAGTNHAFLCRAVSAYPGVEEMESESAYAMVYLYEDLSGQVSILNIADIDIGSLAGQTDAEAAPSFEDFVDLEWSFSSGVGGWGTTMRIAADGTFTGDFHDSEMGEVGDDYPQGTLYGCAFHGRLTMGEKAGEYAWRVHVDEVALDEGQVSEAIEDGIRFVTTDPYGIKAGSDLLLYLPGTPLDALPEGFLFWAHLLGDDLPAELPYYGLYDEAEDTGFIGESLAEDAD